MGAACEEHTAGWGELGWAPLEVQTQQLGGGKEGEKRVEGRTNTTSPTGGGGVLTARGGAHTHSGWDPMNKPRSLGVGGGVPAEEQGREGAPTNRTPPPPGYRPMLSPGQIPVARSVGLSDPPSNPYYFLGGGCVCDSPRAEKDLTRWEGRGDNRDIPPLKVLQW